ncbi:MAG: hypothetical protein WA125_14135 [Desulfosporosinus sp.]
MPKATVICYLSSLLSYGMGFSKMLVLQNAVAEYVNTYDYTTNVSLATGYFAFAIFLAVIGSLFFFYNRYIQNNRVRETIEINNIEFKGIAGRKSDDRRLASILEVKAHLTQSEYGLDLITLTHE